MTRLVEGWRLDVERGPDWVFVRLHPSPALNADASSLGEELTATLQQHFSHRLVIEMEEMPLLDSRLIGQLVLLDQRIHAEGGLMRLCGLSPENQQVLRGALLDQRFPNFLNRVDAVRGCPAKPR